VEVEFKRDPRDGELKLLDVNPRLWTWHTLCRRAGVDFPYLLHLQALGRPLPPAQAVAGVRWIRVATDVLAASRQIRRRQLGIAQYLGTLRPPVELAVFDPRDPLPSVVGAPLAAVRLVSRQLRVALDGRVRQAVNERRAS
jgi:D-aspartate ligase